jgi:hypothetical protein
MQHINRSFKRISYLGFAGLSLLAGCGGTAAGDGVGPTDTGVAEDAASAEEAHCSLLSVPEPIQLLVEKVGQDATVLVTNDAAEDARVRLKAVVITDLGMQTMEDIAEVNVPGNAAVSVALSQAELGLGTGELDAQLIIEATGSYASGRHSGITGELAMSRRPMADRLAKAGPAPIPANLDGSGVGFVTLEPSEEPVTEPGAGTIRPLALVTKQLCFDANITIQGAGVGEDFWTSNSLLIDAKGQEFWGFSPSGVWKQFKTDENGCAVSQQLETGAWTFRAYSMGVLNTSPIITIQVYDTAGLPWAIDFAVTISNSTAVQTLTFTANDPMDAFHIARASLRANSNALTSKTLGKTLLITDGAASTFGTATGVSLNFNDDEKKWDVSHEVGHWVEFNEVVTHTAMAYNNGLAGPPPLCANGAGHTTTSREWSSAAQTEGFASFWAASAFNDETQTSCRTFFSGGSVDCEGSATHATAYMETQCNDGSSQAGHGNETDWQKLFWDLVKPLAGTTQATMRQVLDFAIAADAPSGTNWSTSNHYTLFNTASNAASTPDHVETRWDTFSVSNGIDH